MINLSLGIIVGILATFMLGIWVNKKEKQQAASRIPARISDFKKLQTARKYLGLIANRESIHKARKIANKAIKETA